MDVLCAAVFRTPSVSNKAINCFCLCFKFLCDPLAEGYISNIVVVVSLEIVVGTVILDAVVK